MVGKLPLTVRLRALRETLVWWAAVSNVLSQGLTGAIRGLDSVLEVADKGRKTDGNANPGDQNRATGEA